MLSFDDAVKAVRSGHAMRDAADAERLKLYGLYKQATEGDAPPASWLGGSLFDPRRREMRLAWERCKGKSVLQAKSEYAEAASALLVQPPVNEDARSDGAAPAKP